MSDHSFRTALAAAAARTEAMLATLLPPADDTPQGQLAAAMRHGALAGGKRLRAFLVIEANAILGGDPTGADRAAAAIECLHAYSLIHDDLPCMDDDDLRRGQPTVHVKWDDATAVLAGDALQTIAFEILTAPETHADGTARANLALSLARASGPAGMVGGQVIDIAAETAPVPLTLPEIERLQALKTGALIQCAAELGAIIGGADADQRTALAGFACDLGSAFQIQDDILDVEGDVVLAGKALRKDADAGKATFVSLLGLDGAKQRATEMADSAIAHLAMFGAEDKRVSPHIYRNVTYRNMGGGIGSMKKSTATIEANICFENFYAGIGHDDASPLVFDNECYENVRAGIGVSDGACPIVRNNRCYKNRRAGIGIRTGEATQPIIEHNVCFENEMAGIGNRDEAQPIIRHNKCYKNRMAGIGSRDHARAVIEHNDCYENGMAGIGSRLGAAPVIRHNKCYRNKMAGIGAREGAQPVIEDNECYENLMAGIGCREDADPVVRGNRCYRNVMAGIGSRLGAHPVIVNNECFKNEMAGIGSREGAAPVIRSNHAHDNRMAGIGSRLGARPVIVDNRSLKNNMAGIGVRDSATVAVIVGNRCLENRLVAIGLPDGATGYIHGNELKRTGGGAPPIVALRGGSHAVVTDNVIHEGGVAGLLVSGTAHISGNRFLGRGPDKQGSAIWVPFGGSFDFESIVTASDNVCRGYRNLINANKSSVTAIGNTTRDFSGAALIVKRPTSPARVYGNTAISDAPGSKAIDVDNIDTAAADSNVLRKTADADRDEAESAPAWPLLTGRTNGNSFHELADSGREVVVENGPWKLVATFNKLPTFKLFNSLTDSDLKTDLSEKLDQITFRLRGKLEQKLAVEYQKSMKK